MNIDEKFARYILDLQKRLDNRLDDDYDVQRTNEDIYYRNLLEKYFTILRKERERKELEDWVWYIKVSDDVEVQELIVQIINSDEGWENKILRKKFDELSNKKFDEYLAQTDIIKEYKAYKSVHVMLHGKEKFRY